MNKLFGWWGSPALRRRNLTIITATLILLAVALRYLAGWDAPADLLLFASAVIAGADIAGRALAGLRNRHASIELLVTIAAGGALVIGENWEAAVVTFLFVFGGYLEARTLSRTRQALTQLLDLAPTTAIVLRDGQQIEVMPYEVEPGETVVIKPGRACP